MKEFINGFTSWQETHFEVVNFISLECQKSEMTGNILATQEYQGTGGLYELAENWTDEFESKYAGITWGEEMEYFETIEAFLLLKNTEN